MKILIDADGCPVVKLSASIAHEYNIECIILCDTAHQIDIPFCQTITIDKGKDMVDFALVNRVNKGDIVVTQDYGLASMCLGKQAIVINQDGKEYTSDNIDALLLFRYEAAKLRRSGGRPKGPSKRLSSQDDSFTATLIKKVSEIQQE